MSWLYKVFLGLLAASLTSCALFRENTGPKRTFDSHSEVFYAPFDEVWRAAQLALQFYPMEINNMDLGILQTAPITGSQVWTPPFQEDPPTGGVSYRLDLKVIKGRIKGKKANKVIITKSIVRKKDFFSGPEEVPSDGLEELTILYRIGREIQIERALQRAHQKDQKM